MKVSNKVLAGILIVVAIVIGYYLLIEPNSPVTSQGRPIAVVDLPALTAKASAGKRAYDSSCASCHGSNAAGQEGVAPPLVHRIYEPNHHGDMSFVMAAKNGVRAHHWPFGNMPPVKNITDEDLEIIIVYVRELQRANGIN
jgi:mono/diheme cytochrome c family protein